MYTVWQIIQMYTPFPKPDTRYPDFTLTGLMQFPVNRTVRLTGVWLMGTEYTKFDIRTTRSPVNEKSE